MYHFYIHCQFSQLPFIQTPTNHTPMKGYKLKNMLLASLSVSAELYEQVIYVSLYTLVERINEFLASPSLNSSVSLQGLPFFPDKGWINWFSWSYSTLFIFMSIQDVFDNTMQDPNSSYYKSVLIFYSQLSSYSNYYYFYQNRLGLLPTKIRL